MFTIDQRLSQAHPAHGCSGTKSLDLCTAWQFFKRGHLRLSGSCSATQAPPWAPVHRPTLPGQLVWEVTVKSPLHSRHRSWRQLFVAFPTSGPQVGSRELIREILVILGLTRGGSGVLIPFLLVGAQYITIKFH